MTTPTPPSSLLHRLDAHDRALFLRWSHDRAAPAERTRRVWMALTHAGGATATILGSIIPLFLSGTVHDAARLALATLMVSHVIVQLIKRSVGRARPSCATGCDILIGEPDKFSFPSGHAAAAMSVAFGYAVAFPAMALPLIGFAALAGLSRVRLGVHYFGDVLAGQIIAIVTGVLMLRAS